MIGRRFSSSVAARIAALIVLALLYAKFVMPAVLFFASKSVELMLVRQGAEEVGDEGRCFSEPSSIESPTWIGTHMCGVVLHICLHTGLHMKIPIDEEPMFFSPPAFSGVLFDTWPQCVRQMHPYHPWSSSRCCLYPGVSSWVSPHSCPGWVLGWSLLLWLLGWPWRHFPTAPSSMEAWHSWGVQAAHRWTPPSYGEFIPLQTTIYRSTMETSVFVSQFAPGSPQNWWFIIIFPIYKWQFWSFLCLKLGNGPPNKWNGHLVYTIFTHIVEFLNGPAICRKDQIHPRLFITLFFAALGMQIPVPSFKPILTALLVSCTVLLFRWLGIFLLVYMCRGWSGSGQNMLGRHLQVAVDIGLSISANLPHISFHQTSDKFLPGTPPSAQAGPGWVARPGWASWPRWTSPRSRNLPWWFVPWGWAMATSILGAWWSWPSKGPEGEQLTLLELGVDLSQLFNTQILRTEYNQFFASSLNCIIWKNWWWDWMWVDGLGRS